MFEFSWLEITACLVVLCVWFYFFVQKKYDYFRSRGIPNDKPTFPLGNYWTVLSFKENLMDIVTNTYRRHPGAKLVGIYQGLTPVYVASDPAIVAKILIKEFSNFHDRGFPLDETVNPLDGNLFNLSGSKWKTLRNKLTPTFTSGKLKGMLAIMESNVNALTALLDTVVGQEIEIKDMYSRLTTDVIGSCAFGLDSQSIENPNSIFRRMGEKIFRPNFHFKVKFIIKFVFPKLADALKLKSWPNDVETFFFNIIRQTFDHRAKTEVKRNDFVQLLLELREKGEVKMDPVETRDEEDAYLYLSENVDKLEDNGNLVLNDTLLTAQAFVFFIAGFEGTASSMNFITYLLSKSPDAQDKLRQNIREMKEKYGGFTYDAIRSMDYLEAVVKEGLRMYPPAGLMVRKCNTGVTLDEEEDGSSMTIEKGRMVFIPVQAIQNDHQYFPHPDQFMPERFLGTTPLPGTFLPFGDGPRVCIAQRFAMLELKLTIAKIIDRYRVETCPKMALNEPLKMDPTAFVTTPVGGIFVRLMRLQD